jgi:DOPA 4,5-dioxygenase
MTETTGYHAHVYFDPATRPLATRLREAIISRFTVEPGGFSDEPRGPHPISQFNVIFKNDEFQRIVPWLMFNREGLDVLVHPLTEDMVEDHTNFALWLGTPVALKVDTLKRRGYGADLLPAEAVSEPATGVATNQENRS